jgi:hypothetical protein
MARLGKLRDAGWPTLMLVTHLQLIQILPREWAARWPQYLTFRFLYNNLFFDGDFLPLGSIFFCRMTIGVCAGCSEEYVQVLRKHRGFSATYSSNLLLFELRRTQAVGK